MLTRGRLPRTVVVLGVVSLLNDAASEMIAPLLPVLLTTTLGGGPWIVGLVEGVAQATASVLKLVAGRLTDAGVSARTLILGGYGLSNVVRPLIGLAPGWGSVLALRFLDRLGKGVRSAPRDALLAGSVAASLRGSAFGFHRAMDHTGAVIGPLIASALLAAGLATQEVFLVSVAPGLALMALLYVGVPHQPGRVQRLPALPRWSAFDQRLRRLIVAATVLALAAVPDAFLVLWAHAAGVPVAALPLLWAAAHVLRALAAGLAGGLSDRRGRLPLVLCGWAGRVLLLALLALVPASAALAWTFFLAHCTLTALTEPVEAAFVADRAPLSQRGTALGMYHMLVGLAALPGALVFGAIWQWIDQSAAFLLAAFLSAGAAGALLLGLRGSPPAQA